VLAEVAVVARKGEPRPMRTVLVVALLVVLGLVGYRYVQEGASPPASFEQAARQAGEAARTAAQAAGDAAPRGVDQAGRALEGGAERLQAGAADAQARVVNGIDVGRELRETSERMQAALAGVRQNAADPGAALPTLQDVNRSLEGLEGRLQGMSAEARRVLAGAVAAILPAARGVVRELKANPDAERALGPTLDGILARLEGWARPPAG
jgi:hypothetical protein